MAGTKNLFLAPNENPPIRDNRVSGSLCNLLKVLPTGTVFLFQFLSPLVTNRGHCQSMNKYLTEALIGFCGLSCFLSSFTDSFVDANGMIHYGIVTKNGLWPSSPSESQNMAAYKLRIGDFVHAFFSLLVLAVLVLLDPNTIECYYPSFKSTQKMLMMVLPPVVGAISSSVFVMFPNNRHGIGYPATRASLQ